MRVVHLAASETGLPWLLAIVREQKRRGYDVRVAINGTSGTLAPSLEAAGVPFDVVDMNLPGHSGLLATAKRIIKLVRYLHERKPDVVQYHLFPAIVMGRLAGWLACVPRRFSMIPGPLFLESPVMSDIETGTAWTDTRVIASCEKTRELYLAKNFANERLALIYYGLDPEAFDPARTSRERVRRELDLADSDPLIAFVAYFYSPMRNAHLTPPHLFGRGVKGHETLIDAAPRVAAEFPRVKFLLAGKGWGDEGAAYEQSLRDRVRERGVEQNVIFAGERDDVPEVLAAADLALQCSLSENLGGAIEGLMMAKPMIVTRVGGLVDAVKHEQTGLLVPPSDAGALADAILRLLRDRAFAQQLGANGRQWMLERFTLKRTVDDLKALYTLPADTSYSFVRTLLRLPLLALRVLPIALRLMMARARKK